MSKKITIIFIITFLVFSLCGCANNDTEINNTTKIKKTDLSLEIPNIPVETELATFSTPLKSNGANRLTNVRITCSKINGQIIENGSEFSFEQTIGKSTPEQGYQKADIIVNKKIIQGYGGGNCQVSTTLYNAILDIPGITVTERHPHGRKVNYVPEGKDAAVSYGSLDLKFKNETGNKIKIYASSDDINVTVKIVKIEE